MRIAIINHSRSINGGVETYLRHLFPALSERGHEMSFWHEDEPVAGREMITMPEAAPCWSVTQLGAERALGALRQWQPDVVYAHGLRSPQLEAKTQRIAPSVFFAHSYYGSCVSGTKTFKFPQTQPCDRRFGWQCLLHYYPRQCGGLNPRTMLRSYELQANRLSLLSDYQAIIVASSHMVREYEKYNLAGRLNLVPLPISVEGNQEYPRDSHQSKDKWRILFLGRMDTLKGGATLLDALPAAAHQQNVPLHVTFGGEGEQKRNWEQQASRLAADNPGLKFTFPGWLNESQRDTALRECDLLVLPTLLPEPFGLTGLEAGLYGVPVVAFAVGGIPDWLKHGVNGILAPGDPPRAAELSAAIVRCLNDSDFYEKLRVGAREQAQRYSMKNHLAGLLPILESVVNANQR